MKSNIKTLFILPEYYPHSGGGISTYYLNYLKALKPTVKKVGVLVGSGYVQSDETYVVDGINVEYLKPNIYQKYLNKFSKFDLHPEYRNNIAASWAMYEQANQGEDFDLVECVDFGLGFVPWIIKQNLPVVTRLHGSTGQIELHEKLLQENLNGDMHRHTEYILLGYSSELITHSKANQQYWKNIFKEKTLNFIYPTYQTTLESFVPFNERENLGIVCGRIQQWKGPDVLCEALSYMQNPDIKVNWYGRDTKFDSQFSKSAQLKKKFPKIWGKFINPQSPVPHDQLINIQKKSKYAIIPSTWDMFNFTGLEYMGVGTPIICADGAGVSELIENGVNGFKYSKHDYKSLANCIEKMNNLSSTEYDDMVKKAKCTFSTSLNPIQLIDQNLNIYAKLIANFKPIEINSFLEALYLPQDNSNKIGDILDKQPLKVLMNYTLKRILKKLKNK